MDAKRRKVSILVMLSLAVLFGCAMQRHRVRTLLGNRVVPENQVVIIENYGVKAQVWWKGRPFHMSVDERQQVMGLFGVYIENNSSEKIHYTGSAIVCEDGTQVKGIDVEPSPYGVGQRKYVLEIYPGAKEIFDIAFLCPFSPSKKNRFKLYLEISALSIMWVKDKPNWVWEFEGGYSE